MQIEKANSEKIKFSVLIPILAHQFLMAAVTANISFQTYIISYIYNYDKDIDQIKSYFFTPCFILHLHDDWRSCTGRHRIHRHPPPGSGQRIVPAGQGEAA